MVDGSANSRYYFGALTFRDVPDMQGVPRVPGVKTRVRAASSISDLLRLAGCERSVLVEEFGARNGRAHLHYLTRWPRRPVTFGLYLALTRWESRHGYVSSSEVGDQGRVARYCAKYLTKGEGRMWVDGVRV